MPKSARDRDEEVLAAIRTRGPGTLAAVLGHTPSTNEADAALRLWIEGLVTRDAKGVYAISTERPTETTGPESSQRSEPAILCRFISTSDSPVPGVRVSRKPGSKRGMRGKDVDHGTGHGGRS